MIEMRWINLRDGACPKCSELLQQATTQLVCPKCEFRISEKRCAEIIAGMNGTRKWGKDSGREYEDNLSELNNLQL